MATDGEPGWLRTREQGVEVRVRVVARAPRDKVDGFYGDRLKVRIAAAPVAGEANQALVQLLARLARVPASRGRVVAGTRDRSKTVLLGCDRPAEAAARLRGAVAAGVDKSRNGA